LLASLTKYYNNATVRLSWRLDLLAGIPKGYILGYPLPPLTVCSGTETAFETNAETINSLMFNQLRGVSAFSPVFLYGFIEDVA
jgi:hypothetical protein